MTMLPLNDWMIVEEVDELQVSAGGIVLPEKKKTVIKRGKVLDISPDIILKLKKEEKDLRFAVGDTVLFHTSIGIPVDPMDKDNKMFFMKYDAVMGMILRMK